MEQKILGMWLIQGKCKKNITTLPCLDRNEKKKKMGSKKKKI